MALTNGGEWSLADRRPLPFVPCPLGHIHRAHSGEVATHPVTTGRGHGHRNRVAVPTRHCQGHPNGAAGGLDTGPGPH